MQIESLTCSWMSCQQLLKILQQVLSGEFDQQRYGCVPGDRLQTAAEHGRCPLCA